MTPWFSTPERIHALQTEAERWIGTPFHPHGKVCGRGGGVSCETLPLVLYQAAGVIGDSFCIPVAPIGWGNSHRSSVMSEFLDHCAMFERVEPVLSQLAVGDLLGFRIGRVVHHLGVSVWPGVFVHCLKPQGVHCSALGDATWLKRLGRAWRPV